jgi:hypothetical protein
MSGVALPVAAMSNNFARGRGDWLLDTIHLAPPAKTKCGLAAKA